MHNQFRYELQYELHFVYFPSCTTLALLYYVYGYVYHPATTVSADHVT
jgi:hypothetical protein